MIGGICSLLVIKPVGAQVIVVASALRSLPSCLRDTMHSDGGTAFEAYDNRAESEGVQQNRSWVIIWLHRIKRATITVCIRVLQLLHYRQNVGHRISGEAIYCEDCEMWLYGPTQWDDHKLGRKHRKNVRNRLAVGRGDQQ